MASYDRQARTGYLHDAEHKGPEDRYILKRTIMDMDEAGHIGSRMVAESGQERAIVRLAEKICEERRGETVPMVTQQCHSASNGEVESCIRRVKEQFRTIATHTGAHLSQYVSQDHPLWPWLLEWSAQCLNRFRADSHGRTGTERVRGKKSHKELCMFGEKVLWKPLRLDGNKYPDSEAKIHVGIWLGLRSKSDEDIIRTPRRIVRARAIRRLPADQRWDDVLASMIKGTPRFSTPGRGTHHIPVRPGMPQDAGDGEDSSGDDDDDDGDDPGPKSKKPRSEYPLRPASKQAPAAEGGTPGDEGAPRTRSPIPDRDDHLQDLPKGRNRGVYLHDVVRLGPTSNCYRCNNPKGRGGSHSDECRARIWKELGKAAEGGHAWAQRKVRIEEQRQLRIIREGGGFPTGPPRGDWTIGSESGSNARVGSTLIFVVI